MYEIFVKVIKYIILKKSFYYTQKKNCFFYTRKKKFYTRKKIVFSTHEKKIAAEFMARKPHRTEGRGATLPDCKKKTHRLSGKLASLGTMGDQLRAPLNSLNTTML